MVIIRAKPNSIWCSAKVHKRSTKALAFLLLQNRMINTPPGEWENKLIFSPLPKASHHLHCWEAFFMNRYKVIATSASTFFNKSNWYMLQNQSIKKNVAFFRNYCRAYFVYLNMDSWIECLNNSYSLVLPHHHFGSSHPVFQQQLIENLWISKNLINAIWGNSCKW